MKTLYFKIITCIAIGLLGSCQLSKQIELVNNPVSSMTADVRFLASDLLEGREVGTAGEKLAAEYLAARFESIGIKPVADSYFQDFSVQKKSNPHADAPAADDPLIAGKNVVAFQDNGKQHTLVLGAHYDHLGYGPEGSLYTGPPAIHNGADDNASGVALLLALAEYTQQHCSQYNYMFIAFSGEEKGLWGSNFFAKNPMIDLSNVNAMLNFDMVGRLNPTKQLAVYGTGTSPVWDNLLDKHNQYELMLKKDPSGVGPSDHTSFYLQDLPVLQFFTGQHEDYHRPSDDFEKINFDGMLVLYKYVSALIQDMDDDPKIAFTKTKDDSQQESDFKVTLGVVPDYLYSGKGMRIDGVREGKTAHAAGIQDGDIVLQMGDLQILDMMSYMKALGAFEKGQTTSVKVKRGDEEIEKTVTFK